MYCEACGLNNLETARRCIRCGHDLLATYVAKESPQLSRVDPEPRNGPAVELKPHNYFIAISYIAIAAVGSWITAGATGGWPGLLRALVFVVAALGVISVISLMDSSAPGSPKNRRALRTLLAAAILGGTAAALGAPPYIYVVAATFGAVLGILGWNWIKDASI